jgi:hypothetical protein
MKRSPEALAALDSLPNHPVFLCDLNAGVIAIALRFHARDSIDRYTSAESNKTYGFPCAQSSAAIRRTLEVAAEKLGALVDFSPILAILERPCAGHVGFDRGLHDGLEALADLALHPGHVVLDRHGWADDVPIEQLLGAIHLALFGSLPLIQHRRASGCPDCDKSLALGASRILAETLAGANISGSLRPGLRAPGLLVHAAAVLEGRESVFISPEKAALRLAVAAKRIVDTIDPAERAHLERFYPELVREAVDSASYPAQIRHSRNRRMPTSGSAGARAADASLSGARAGAPTTSATTPKPTTTRMVPHARERQT